MFDVTRAYFYTTVESDQDREVNNIIKDLEKLRIERREFEENMFLEHFNKITFVHSD